MEDLKELDYDLSFIAVGKPESEAKEYLKQSRFKRPRSLTWYDEPKPIIIKDRYNRKESVLGNLEYIYSFKGEEVIESVKMKPIDSKVKGTSIALPSSLLKFIRQSCLQTFIPPDLGTMGNKSLTKEERNKKDVRGRYFEFTYDDLRIEALMMDFFSQILQMSNWKMPLKNDFIIETLSNIEIEKYSYKPVVELHERKKMGEITKNETSHMPYLLRKNKLNAEVDALCPYCQFEPTYVPYRASSSSSYSFHLLKYHRVLGTGFIKPAIPQVLVRNSKRHKDGIEIDKFLQMWLICPYRSCKGMSYFFAAKLAYGKDLVCFKNQIDIDKIFLEYNEHYLKNHIESSMLQRRGKGRGI